MKRKEGISGPRVQDIILDSLNEGVFTVDTQWRITSFNRAAERITGVPKNEAIGKACFDVFHADLCEKACPLRRTLETGTPIMNAAAHIITIEGRCVPIRISAAVLKDDSGNHIGGVETFQDLSQIEQLKKELEGRRAFEDIIGRSPAMMDLFELLLQVAQSPSTVLIEGRSGTGKELFARAIHNLSARSRKRFVPVNCAALPDSLLESELFGYKKGAFTDARRDKPGRFVLADGGTLFLDEIADISPAMQAKLLRVLQDHVVEPLGSVEPIKVDVRLIAATNRNLTELVRAGTFREDLFYRIRVVHLKLPCLKERREDIPLLVDHFITKLNHLHGKEIAGVSVDVMARLMEYDYPGNVRELENIIEHAFVLCRGGIIELHHLPPELQRPPETGPGSLVPMSLRDMERSLITETLRCYGGNRRRAAKALAINPSTLYRKISALGIEAPETDGRGRRR